MIKTVFVIFDNVSQEVATVPLVTENAQTAMRNLQDSKLPDTMEKHPEDFDLIQLGTLDTSECVFYSDKKFVCHIGALKHGE